MTTERYGTADDTRSMRWDGTRGEMVPASNYVPALPSTPRQLAPYNPMVDVPAPVVTVDDDGSHALERAQAFALRTSVLGVAFGVAAAVLVAWVVADKGAGAMFGAAVVTLFGVFATTWGGALWMDIANSPGGVARLNTRRMWGVIEREQAHRHDMTWAQWEADNAGNHK